MSESNLKNFLANIKSGQKHQEQPSQEEHEVRIVVPDEAPQQSVEVSVEEPTLAEQESQDTVLAEEEAQDTILALKAQIEELKQTVDELRANPPMPDMSAFLTSREQIKSLTNAIERQNIEITNKSLMTSMEQIAIMREDFFKLCDGMRKKIDTMSAKDVLSSFEAYEVDMENILTDAGVFIGHFPYETLNTIHQRIVDVILTNDQEKNGQIAERLSDGYKLGDRVLLKERISVYKYTDEALPVAKEPEPEPEKETPAKTKTTSKKKRTTKKTKATEAEE